MTRAIQHGRSQNTVQRIFSFIFLASHYPDLIHINSIVVLSSEQPKDEIDKEDDGKGDDKKDDEAEDEPGSSPSKKPKSSAGASAGASDVKEIVFSFDTTGSMYPCLTQVTAIA